VIGYYVPCAYAAEMRVAKRYLQEKRQPPAPSRGFGIPFNGLPGVTDLSSSHDECRGLRTHRSIRSGTRLRCSTANSAIATVEQKIAYLCMGSEHRYEGGDVPIEQALPRSGGARRHEP
jgi:hypothetical protein